MACNPLVYHGVGASEWANVKQAVSREYGIRIDSNRGEASRRGFTLNWAYEPSGHTLRIECSRKPFLIPCSKVNGRIQHMADGCGLTAVDAV